MTPELPERIAASIDRFTGRTWLLPEILAWWEQRPDERIVLLTGGPGAGKSMVLAWLAGCGLPPDGAVEREQLARIRAAVKAAHFCQAASRNIAPQAFAQSISNQLTGTVKGFGDALAATLADQVKIVGMAHAGSVSGGAVAGVTINRLDLAGLGDESSFDRGFTEPLKKLYTTGYSEPMLLLVDALDEAQTYTGVTIPKLLSRLSDLPGPVRMIITTRDDPRVLKLYRNARRLDLVDDAPPDVDDVRDYALRRLATLPYGETERAQFAARLADKAGGIFLYAAMVLDEVLGLPPAKMPNLRLYPLPNGLGGLYRDFLNRELGGDEHRWFDTYEPLLGLIAVAQGEGLTATQLDAIIGQDIRAGLRACKQYLSGDLPEGPFRLFHQSFTEFLLNKEDNQDFHIAAECMHKRIADHFWSIHHEAFPPGKGWLEADPYACAHLARHAAEAGLLDRFVSDPLFLIASDPASLRSVIERCSSPQASAYRDVYVRTSLVGLDFSERASHLELAARRCLEGAIADAFARLPIGRRWRVPWVHSLAETPYRNLGQPAGEIGGIAMIPGEENRVAVVGRDEDGSWLMILNAHGEIVSRSAVRNVPIAVSVVQVDDERALAVFEHRLDMDQKRIEDCGHELSISLWTTDDVPQRTLTCPLTDRPHFSESLRRAAIRSAGGELIAAVGGSSWTHVMRLESHAGRFRQRETESIWVRTAPFAITEFDGRPAIILETFSELNIHVFGADENGPATKAGRCIEINDDDAWIRCELPETIETYGTALAVSSCGTNYIAVGDYEGNTYIFARPSGDGELSLHGRLYGTGGEIRHLDIRDERGTITVISADQSNNLKRWSLVHSRENVYDRLYEQAFFLRPDGPQTYLLERRTTVNNDGTSSHGDRLWRLTGAIGVYDAPDANEALQTYRYRTAYVSRHDLVFVDRQPYRLERYLRLGGPTQLVVTGPREREIGQPIVLARTAGTADPPPDHARERANFDLCRIGDRLAIIEINGKSMILWIHPRAFHDEEPATETEPWQRREVLRSDGPHEEGIVSLVRAYLLGGGADLELSWLDAIRRLGATWTWGTELEPEWMTFEMIDADKIRIKVLDDVLVIAAAGRSTLRIFEAGKAQEELIASLNVGELIQDLEFADSDSVALVTSGGSLVVTFNRPA